jgi:hypothetical protein
LKVGFPGELFGRVHKRLTIKGIAARSRLSGASAYRKAAED